MLTVLTAHDSFFTMHDYIMIRELARKLGLTYDATLKLRRRLSIGKFHAGMWWISPEDVETAKANSKKYLLSQR